MMTARTPYPPGSMAAPAGQKGMMSPVLCSRQAHPAMVAAMPTPGRSVASAARQAMQPGRQTPCMNAPPPMPSRGTLGGVGPCAAALLSPALTSRETRGMGAASYQPVFSQRGSLAGSATPGNPLPSHVQRRTSGSLSASALPGLPRPRLEVQSLQNQPSYVPVPVPSGQSPHMPPRAEVVTSGAGALPFAQIEPSSQGRPPVGRDSSVTRQRPQLVPQCQSLVVDTASQLSAQQVATAQGQPATSRGRTPAQSWAPPIKRETQSWAPPLSRDMPQHSLPQCESLVLDMGAQMGNVFPQCQSLIVDARPPPLPQCQSLLVEMPHHGSNVGLPQCQSLVVDMGNPGASSLPQCQSLLVEAPNLFARAPGNGLAGCQTMVAMPNSQEMAAIAQSQSWLAPANQQGLAQAQSMIAVYPDYQLPQARGQQRSAKYGPLRFASAYESRQHPAKVNTGIPNADAVLEGIDYLGVADGVSGVHGLGIPPQALPWELLRSAGKKLFAAAANDEPKRGIDLGSWLINLIQQAYDATKELGATTLLLAALKGDQLVTACLGDSAILVLRPTGLKPLKLTSIFKTEPGRYDARRPVQVQRLEGLNVAGAHEVIKKAEVSTTPVQPGDILVLGSDGLFDNLSDADIQRVIERCCCEATGCNEELQQAASTLVELAISRVNLDPDANKGPWQGDSNEVPANNADDTTALVGMVQAEALAPDAQVMGELGLEQDSRRRVQQKKRHGVFGTCGMSLDRMVSVDGATSRAGASSQKRASSIGGAGAARRKKNEECVIA
eukprot:TRINITY_DN19486_c0_g1_i1.p1 TRINITY_DN19486_c0_g1~~TRINITY_DN19486_c0_g1_i1.p1  ORF type:complete len:782 (-),score=124.57 TRINITY_DN19486_c0_g1_i1:136-2481(-)